MAPSAHQFSKISPFSMLNAVKLCKRYGSTTVVDRLDLCVDIGQIRGLLGPNGAGKTTTLNMICGVLAPSDGKVEVDGFDLATNPLEVKQRIGYVPDGAPLPPELFPKEYFIAIGRMYGLPKDQVQSVRLAGTPLLPTEVQKIYL